MDARVTILTDFGAEDGYVAAMKGVLATRVPGVVLDDAGHDLPQGAVARGALALARYWDRYPPGSVHLVVVDPGVGTGRKALAVEADGRFVVAPDNGVVSRVLERAESWRAVEVRTENVGAPAQSATFHGRDLFAPAAARLARREGLDALGPPVDEPVRIEEPEPRRDGSVLVGRVVTVDRFGNLITNVPGDRLGEAAVVVVGDRRLRLRHTYGEAEVGSPLALVNSANRLEVAVRNGSAAGALDLDVGAKVRIEGALDQA